MKIVDKVEGIYITQTLNIDKSIDNCNINDSQGKLETLSKDPTFKSSFTQINRELKAVHHSENSLDSCYTPVYAPVQT